MGWYGLKDALFMLGNVPPKGLMVMYDGIITAFWTSSRDDSLVTEFSAFTESFWMILSLRTPTVKPFQIGEARHILIPSYSYEYFGHYYIFTLGNTSITTRSFSYNMIVLCYLLAIFRDGTLSRTGGVIIN